VGAVAVLLCTIHLDHNSETMTKISYSKNKFESKSGTIL